MYIPDYKSIFMLRIGIVHIPDYKSKIMLISSSVYTWLQKYNYVKR